MATKELKPALSRRRRHHDAEFKAKIVGGSLHPGITIAAVALANEINPNLLRRWIKEYQYRQTLPDGADAKAGSG
ncbi:MAG: transposase [Rhodocyclaceae bacterium]|nr:transposase [Rhodocyclaceae bacterium]